MRRIRHHAEPLPLERVRGLFPGLERSIAWLQLELEHQLKAATAAGADLRHRVVHVQPDSITIVDRAEQVALLRHAGVRKLAADLSQAVVRPGTVLVFCDFEGASWVSIANIAALLGEVQA